MKHDRTPKTMYPECTGVIKNQKLMSGFKTPTALVNPFYLTTHDSDDYEKLIDAGFSVEDMENSYRENGYYAFFASESGALSDCIEMVKRLELNYASCHMRTNINKNIYIVR